MDVRKVGACSVLSSFRRVLHVQESPPSIDLSRCMQQSGPLDKPHLGGTRSARCSTTSATAHVGKPCPDVHVAQLRILGVRSESIKNSHTLHTQFSASCRGFCCRAFPGCLSLLAHEAVNHDDEHALIGAGGAGVCSIALPALLRGRGAGGRDAANCHPSQKRGLEHEHAATQRGHAGQVSPCRLCSQFSAWPLFHNSLCVHDPAVFTRRQLLPLHPHL